MLIGSLVIPLVISLGLYIYFSLAFMAIGKKARLSMPGLAWIPAIGPVIIIYQASKMHWWPWLLLLSILIFWIPVIGVIIYSIATILFLIYVVIWGWKMFEAINRPGWWSILLLIPIVGLIIIGIAAWSEK